MMDPIRVKASLNKIASVYRSILDDSYHIVIPSAVSSVDATKQEYYRVIDSRAGKTWGYTISPRSPLRFRPSRVLRGIEPQVDIYCNIQWADDDVPVIQEIKLRIWSKHRDTVFDPERDSETINRLLYDPERGYYRGWRVVSRIHFDRVNRESGTGSGFHPVYHMQFGGKPEANELCWHPKAIDIPRLAHQPMELFLTCQMVARVFFPEEYKEIRKRGEWRQELILYQNLLLADYYKKCVAIVQNNDSLLDGLETI